MIHIKQIGTFHQDILQSGLRIKSWQGSHGSGCCTKVVGLGIENTYPAHLKYTLILSHPSLLIMSCPVLFCYWHTKNKKQPHAHNTPTLLILLPHLNHIQIIQLLLCLALSYPFCLQPPLPNSFPHPIQSLP